MNMEKIGRYLFLLGLVITVIAGFVDIGIYGLAGLFVLGIIVGILNITGKEVQPFLLGTVALLLVGSSLGALATITGPQVVAIINNFITFVAGGALIVALKEVYSLTSSK
ncbi:MAG: hypothetical protein NTY20_01995 [Candidatus Aenigmarchaeota archaeon]|nr:hypothetical protein [Candidatus Aenigmarchaeota archaeon]